MDKVNPILVLYVHPHRQQSRVNRAMREAIADLEAVTLVDLYEEYPDFLINVRREQQRLREHRLIVFQHPIFWYSCPPLLKEWLDVVLLRGFAYGEGGTALHGKDFLQVLSTGAPCAAYDPTGYHHFTMTELLRPFEATAKLCGWVYHQPFLVQGLRQNEDDILHGKAQAYRQLLQAYASHGASALAWNRSQAEGGHLE